MKWTERTIARALAQQTFNRKYLVVVPNCNWTGYEADVLAVTTDLRLIDVEIKISRADLKADAKKDKWWHRQFSGWEPVGESRTKAVYESTPQTHPPKVWKHYYLLPFEIWAPELEKCLPSEASGILFIHDWHGNGQPQIVVHRQAKPARDAYRLNAEQVVNIARLASLRMWDAYQQLDRLRERAQGDAEEINHA